MFELKTIAFEFVTMSKMIGYGTPLMRGIEFVGFDQLKDPTRLEFGVWMHFVPVEFRDLAARSVKYVLDDRKYLEKEFTDENKVRMILEMREFIKMTMYEEGRISLR